MATQDGEGPCWTCGGCGYLVEDAYDLDGDQVPPGSPPCPACLTHGWVTLGRAVELREAAARGGQIDR